MQLRLRLSSIILGSFLSKRDVNYPILDSIPQITKEYENWLISYSEQQCNRRITIKLHPVGILAVVVVYLDQQPRITQREKVILKNIA